MYKLIFADDEAIVRENLARIVDWENLGFRLLCCCANGHELLEMVDSEQPDLVITDLNMPFISGIDATKQIKLAYQHMKIVFLTGYDEFEYAQEAIDLKVSKYILKPVTADKLTKILDEIKTELDDEFESSANLSKLKQFYDEYSPVYATPGMSSGHQASCVPYIDEARKYIAGNYSNPKLSAQIVSDHLAISASHFRYLFSKELGMPFVKYLTLFRLEKSKQLLLGSDKKIYEIADETGFSSSQYYCYCFKRHFDMAPLDIRCVR